MKKPKDTTHRRVPIAEAPLGADATIREACAELRCAPSTLWRLINAGELHAYKVGRVNRINRPSIDSLKQRNAVQPRQVCA